MPPAVRRKIFYCLMVKGFALEQTHISHIVLRKENVKADWKLSLPKDKNNGRRVFVNKIFPNKEMHIQNPEWCASPANELTPVFETDYGGIEIATFTNNAKQDYHKHLFATEIYTVLEGTMQIKVNGAQLPINLLTGDEIIILPETEHEIVTSKEPFLTRVHSINCHGDRDKYVKDVNNQWSQVFTHK
jgi:quercetin dioxygenase-like cupin family protein